MKFVPWAAFVGAVIAVVFDDLLNAAGLHWLVWPFVGLLVLFVIVGQLTVWYRQGWRLRWPPGKRS